jgi:hypothetical protein
MCKALGSISSNEKKKVYLSLSLELMLFQTTLRNGKAKKDTTQLILYTYLKMD